MYTIAVDAMGGDFAPKITAAGSIRALETFEQIKILLVGQADRIEPLLSKAAAVRPRLQVIDARETIANTESPVLAIRTKTDSSLVRALSLVRDGQAQALISAGSTGAVMAGALFRLGRLPGIDRPALATLLPTVTGSPALLMDVGANVDCQPEWLVQFGRMGATYMRQVLGVKNPRVALLNIGEEAEKGNQLTKAAYPLMEQGGFSFIGNLEARGVPMGETDVIVADGFSGNILLKSMEGISKAIFTLMKDELMRSKRSKIGAYLARNAFSRLKKNLSADEVGGAPLLGTTGAVIKAHGNSSEYAFFCAIRQALSMLEGNVVSLIADQAQASIPS